MMRNMRRGILLNTVLCALLLVGGRSAARAKAVESLFLVDTPTPEVSDQYAYYLSFRFYSDGGLLSSAYFGVFPRLNIGFGLDTEKFIGNQTADLNKPTLNVRFRFFDGERLIPALALGYDGQGLFYNKTTDKYNEREKGLYLVGSNEIIVPELEMSGGVNIYDFKEDRLFLFTGLSYTFRNVFSLMLEADNLAGSKARNSRINLGGRYAVSSHVSIDVMGRELWAGGRKSERVVRINYSGSF